MKQTRKKIIILLILAGFLIVGFNLVSYKEAKAETIKKEIPLQMQVPGLSKLCSDQTRGKYCVSDYGEYLIYFYHYFVGVAGILAAVMIIYAGFIWITAAGNQQRIENAKSTMNGAAIGLVLTLVSFVLLNTISPNLVRMKFPTLPTVKKILQSQYICEANQNVYDETTNQWVVPYYLSGEFVEKTDKQGNTVKLPKCGTINKMRSDLGEGGECIGTTCPGNSQLCYEDRTSHDMNCLPAADVCLKTNKNECGDTDKLIQIAAETDPTLRDKACRLDAFGIDTCRLGAILKCPTDQKRYGSDQHEDSLYYGERVQCGFAGDTAAGATTEARKTPCWDYNKPKGNCSDDPRAAESANSICCGTVYNKVNCKSSCGEGEKQLDCSRFDFTCNSPKVCCGILGIECKDKCDNNEVAVKCDYAKEYTISCSSPKICCLQLYSWNGDIYD